MVDLQKTKNLLKKGQEGSGKKEVGKYAELDFMANSPVLYVQHVKVSKD